MPTGEEREFQSDCREEILSLIDYLGDVDWQDAMVIKGREQDAGWIHLFHLRNLGWLVVCCGDSDAIEYYVSSGESSERISVHKAGQTEEFGRNQFVSRELSLIAVAEFLHTRERDESLDWQAIGK